MVQGLRLHTPNAGPWDLTHGRGTISHIPPLRVHSAQLKQAPWTVVLEDSGESLGLQGDPPSPSQSRSVLNIHWKDWCWSWNSNTLATSCKEWIHWKRPWCWERLKAGWEGDNRGWGGWMASPTWRTWMWASSGRQWRTGKPGKLYSMGLQSWTRLSNWTTISYELTCRCKPLKHRSHSSSWHYAAIWNGATFFKTRPLDLKRLHTFES